MQLAGSRVYQIRQRLAEREIVTNSVTWLSCEKVPEPSRGAPDGGRGRGSPAAESIRSAGAVLNAKSFAIQLLGSVAKEFPSNREALDPIGAPVDLHELRVAIDTAVRSGSGADWS